MTKRLAFFTLFCLLLAPTFAVARQQSKVPPAPATGATQSQEEFLKAADQVLAQMSRLIDLPILHPLKKSMRTKAQIRAYLVEEDKEDKHPAKRYADKKALEAFGLIPQGFDLDGFMLNLLTEQIAGYYDPKAQEFYIADWIPLSDQRMVMAHELTHALQDQHFHIDPWIRDAKPNDDGQAARQAVLEGSAVVAMLDYEMRGLGSSIRDMPDIGPLTQAMIGDASSSPDFAKAPPYIRDSLLFPYLNGAVFTQRLLKAGDGWPDFYKVFSRPPVSSQQVMQPSLYLTDKAPPPVTFPNLGHLLGKHWKLLDENIVGEFGLQEILKQYLDAAQAKEFTPDWWGDRYAILENKTSKSSLLVFRLRLDSAAHAAQFFTTYSDLLRKKHADAKQVFNAPEFLQFDTASQGGVFFECQASECLSMEGADRQDFDKVTKAMHWPKAPQPAKLAAISGPGAPSRQARDPACAQPSAYRSVAARLYPHPVA
jgi:hypothetical protein